jgi:DNA repair exonuclease SbcCD ATPase subunit
MATEPSTKAATVDVTHVKTLEAELKAAREEVRRSLLESIQNKIAELREIGFEYRLKEVAGARRPPQTRADKVCPVCGETGHDKRAHKQKKK